MAPCAAPKYFPGFDVQTRQNVRGFEDETTKRVSTTFSPWSWCMPPLVVDFPTIKSLCLYLTWSTTMLTWPTRSTPSPHAHLLIDPQVSATHGPSSSPLSLGINLHVRSSPLLSIDMTWLPCSVLQLFCSFVCFKCRGKFIHISFKKLIFNQHSAYIYHPNCSGYEGI